jgi:hypothetical protein
MNKSIAVAGFLAGVGLTLVNLFILGSLFEGVAWPYIYSFRTHSDAIITPPLYWPVIFGLGLPLAIIVGLRSYRATLKRYEGRI